MAILIADGFDFYANTIDFTYVGSPWASTCQNFSTAQTPYGVGQSMNITANTVTSVQWATNEPTVYATFDLCPQGVFTGTNTQGFFFSFMDISSYQVTLQWAQDGNFYVRSGNTAGAIIAGPWAHGMANASWCNWQAQVVINNTTGSVTLRKNNNPANDIAFTGLNTRAGSTNNYANKVSLTDATTAYYVDNLFVNSASGAAPTSWVGQVRSVQLMPSGDTATKALTPSAGSSVTLGTNSTASNYTVSANLILWSANSITAIGGTCASITAKLNAGITGHVKCALYTDSAGTPNNFVAGTVEVTNPVLGDNVFTFSSPPTLTRNAVYWVALWGDTAFVLNGAAGLPTNKNQTLTYVGGGGSAGWPANTALGTNFTGYANSVRITINVSNNGMVSEAIEDADSTFVYGSTAGNVDLYTLQQLTAPPAGIVAVVTRNLMRKSDTGSRTATTEIQSGATNQDQATFNLAVTYGWQNVYFPTDPNTGATWTFAGVNALLVGPKVVA
jgi:hypothetical protein